MIKVVVSKGDSKTKQDREDDHKHQQYEAGRDHQIRETLAEQHLILLAYAIQRHAFIALFAVNPGIAQREEIDQQTECDNQYADYPFRQQENRVIPRDFLA